MSGHEPPGPTSAGDRAAPETAAPATPGAAGEPGPPSRARYLGGCWLLIVGYFAGGMIAVGIAKLVGAVTNCRPEPGFPACNFEPYFQVGTLVGAILLPSLFIWRLWQNDAARRKQERG